MNQLKASILCLLFLCLSACGRQVVEFGKDDAGTVARPTVISTRPLDNATGVALDTTISATFDQAMDAATLDASTFTVTQGTTPIAGTVTLDAPTNTASFQPALALTQDLIYIVLVSTGAKGSTGLGLAADYTWSFSTAGSVSSEAPTVVATTPLDQAVGVSTSSAPTAKFSKPMDATTITAGTFQVEQDGTAVSGTVTLSAATNTATFTPDVLLGAGLVYTATITIGAHDSSGLALGANFVWTFTTATNAAVPAIVATTPLDLAIDVSVNEQPTVTFNTAMDPTTITNLTFTLKQGALSVAGVVTLDVLTNTATFTPLSPLEVGLVYTAMVSTGAKALGGVALAANSSWSFTTAACSQASVVLGAASGFAVLAGSTVTSTGLTMIAGDLGVSPGTAITGFPPGIIVGNQHAGDPTAAQGIADLTTAYNDAAGRTLCPVTVSGNLGGRTLTPGLYKSTTSLAVSSGDLTLDAQGDGNAVFVFQMASTLTTTTGRQVILTNGAKSGNVYWQVGTSATLGTTSLFQGTIMADQAITLGTGATLNGRALARIAAINLDGNSIVKPLP